MLSIIYSEENRKSSQFCCFDKTESLFLYIYNSVTILPSAEKKEEKVDFLILRNLVGAQTKFREAPAMFREAPTKFPEAPTKFPEASTKFRRAPTMFRKGRYN